MYRYLFILIFVFCSNPAEDNYTVEYVDGIKHIYNISPLWGEKPEISIEFIRTIGELDGTDNNYQLFRPIDAVMDSEDNIYVLDSGNYRVQKYDKNGLYVKSIGKKGEGPGEFRSTPSDLGILSGDRLFVYDMRNERLHIFTLEGDYVTSKGRRLF
ncbi:6-bladed beta-propeller [candidate division KSB1 bacterium]